LRLNYASTSAHHFIVNDEQIGKQIAFRPVTMEADFERIHRWMHQEHVIPFWQLNLPLAKFREHLQKELAGHQQLYIGSLDDTPVSYWETYRVIEDRLGRYYEAESDDHGVHLLIGETSYLGKGYALPLLRAITYHLFQQTHCGKVVAEPDIRNQKMIHIFEKCGYQKQQKLQLPEKEACLLFCTRKTFMRRWRFA
jgi:RimJ/RimL family protein N-acetyltransferase